MLKLKINHFIPANKRGELKSKEVYPIIIDLLNQKGFTCINKNDKLNECIFSSDNKNYKFECMEAFRIDPKGNKGLDIDFIQLQEVV